MTRASQRGFTLIELVITIVVGSIVVAFMAMFIVIPMEAYSAQTRRAQLVDDADSALRFMGRDLRSALPNSVRVTSSNTVIEFLATVDGARYVDGAPLTNAALALDFTQLDGAFSTSVPFTQPLPWSSAAAYLAIYNVGVPGADAYEIPSKVMTGRSAISIIAGATANQNLVTFSPSFQFGYESPGKRVYLVSGPVSYVCDASAGTLTRYSGYNISTIQPADAATLMANGATASVVSADVGSCTFTYTPGTSAQRNALTTLTLRLTQSGEFVQLLYEVQLVNSP